MTVASCGYESPHLARLRSRTGTFFAALAHMMAWTCLEMIEAIFLAPKVQLAVVTNPVFLGLCPMTLRCFIRNK